MRVYLIAALLLISSSSYAGPFCEQSIDPTVKYTWQTQTLNILEYVDLRNGADFSERQNLLLAVRKHSAILEGRLYTLTETSKRLHTAFSHTYSFWQRRFGRNPQMLKDMKAMIVVDREIVALNAALEILLATDLNLLGTPKNQPLVTDVDSVARLKQIFEISP